MNRESERVIILIMKKDPQERHQNRIIYIEALRIFSAILVIFNHTEINGYFLFSTRSMGSILYWTDLFFSVFCKCAVYIFFAISGALYLDRKPSDIRNYLCRILKVVAILVTISFVYYLALIIPAGLSFDIKAFVTMIYTCTVSQHLWFLYAYLAFLIVLPFLQAIASTMTNKMVAVVVILSLILNGFIPFAQYFLFKGNYALTDAFSPWITSTVFLYPVLGHYLHNCNLEKANKYLYCLWIFNIVTILISELMVTYESIVEGVLSEKDSQQFISSFVVVNTITVWLTFRIVFGRIKSAKVKRIIALFGSATFGVYLLHPLVLESKWIVMLRESLTRYGMPRMIACFVWVMVTFIFTSLITIVFNEINGKILEKCLLRK